MDPLWFLDVFSKVDEAITILEKYKTKLKGDYDTAYLKLDEAMDEIDKMVDSILEWLKKFVYLHPDEVTDEMKRGELKLVLLDFEVNAMRKNIEKSRGHCHKVWNIYGKYLENYFSAKLNSKELEEVRYAFVILGNMDGSLFAAMEELCNFLPQKASELQSLLEAGKSLEEIGKEHGRNREDLLKIYKYISNTMEKMYRVRNWFIQIGKIA